MTEPREQNGGKTQSGSDEAPHNPGLSPDPKGTPGIGDKSSGGQGIPPEVAKDPSRQPS